MSIVLITGAATGIGNLTARALASAGHTVYASMRAPASRNAASADDLLQTAQRDGVNLRVVELDVTYQDSAYAAIENRSVGSRATRRSGTQCRSLGAGLRRGLHR